MHKKFLFLIVVLLGIAVLVAGCGPSSSPESTEPPRDLSTPSSRLVGHWHREFQDWHDYFGPVDEETKTGNYIQVDELGKATYAEYRVISQTLDGFEITIAIILPVDLGVNELPSEYVIYKDGTIMRGAENPSINTYKYIGPEAEP